MSSSELIKEHVRKILDRLRQQQTRDTINRLLTYDPLTGDFRWKVSRGKARVGSLAGSITIKAYHYITVDYKVYPASHLAWLIMTGEWPKNEIDHKDRNKLNNAFDNLREATHSQNMQNVGLIGSNTSGYRGVSFSQYMGRWRADIQVNKKQIYLGLFDTPEQAYAAYQAAATRLHGEFSNDGR